MLANPEERRIEHYEKREPTLLSHVRRRSKGGKGGRQQKRTSQRHVKASEFGITRLTPPIRARVQMLAVAQGGVEQVADDPWGCLTKPDAFRLVLGSSPALPEDKGSNESATTDIAHSQHVVERRVKPESPGRYPSQNGITPGNPED